jgi:hypothetical protein
MTQALGFLSKTPRAEESVSYYIKRSKSAELLNGKFIVCCGMSVMSALVIASLNLHGLREACLFGVRNMASSPRGPDGSSQLTTCMDLFQKTLCISKHS